MAKQTSRAKPTTSVLILREKQRPKAFLLEAEAAAKFTEGAFNVVDKVVDAFERDTIFSVFVRDSFAIDDKHSIELTIKILQGMDCILNRSPCEYRSRRNRTLQLPKTAFLRFASRLHPSRPQG